MEDGESEDEDGKVQRGKKYEDAANNYFSMEWQKCKISKNDVGRVNIVASIWNGSSGEGESCGEKNEKMEDKSDHIFVL